MTRDDLAAEFLRILRSPPPGSLIDALLAAADQYAASEVEATCRPQDPRWKTWRKPQDETRRSA